MFTGKRPIVAMPKTVELGEGGGCVEEVFLLLYYHEKFVILMHEI